MRSDVFQAIIHLMQYGPTRVVISHEGEATTAFRAKKEHGIVSDIVLLRNDLWALGAPQKYLEVAFMQYRDEWIYAVDKQWIYKRVSSNGGFPFIKQEELIYIWRYQHDPARL